MQNHRHDPDSKDIDKCCKPKEGTVYQRSVPPLIRVARVIEYNETLNHCCTKEWGCRSKGLPGEYADPSRGVSPCCAELLGGKLYDEVVLTSSGWVPGKEEVVREFAMDDRALDSHGSQLR